MSPPSLTIDLTPDLDFSPATTTIQQTSNNGQQQRTLLLAPPSLPALGAQGEARLASLFALYPRAATDLHMLDRLAAGLVTLPLATYDLILILTGTLVADEERQLLRDRALWGKIAGAVKPGGIVKGEDGNAVSLTGDKDVVKEAVLAGLVVRDGGGEFGKPEYAEEEVVPLKLGFGKKKETATKLAAPAPTQTTVPAGVGFVDFSDDLDLDAEDDDDVIDEETLLTEEDMRRGPMQPPPECAPKLNKKRRACKDWYVSPNPHAHLFIVNMMLIMT